MLYYVELLGILRYEFFFISLLNDQYICFNYVTVSFCLGLVHKILFLYKAVLSC